MKNGIAKSIHRLEENDLIIIDRKEILKNIHNFYETLYTLQKISEQKTDFYLENFNPPNLGRNMFEKIRHAHSKRRSTKSNIRFDIINNSGEFYSEQELKTKYSIKTNFLQVNGIIWSVKEFLKLKTDIKTFTKKVTTAKTSHIPDSVCHT